MELIKRSINLYFSPPEALERRDRNQRLGHFYHEDKQWKETKSCTACSPPSHYFDKDKKYNLEGQQKTKNQKLNTRLRIVCRREGCIVSAIRNYLPS